jgi:Domain of unknown function (DUF1707)
MSGLDAVSCSNGGRRARARPAMWWRARASGRDRTTAALREHLAAARLTFEEFDERLDRAYAAKTLGELAEIMTDLPAVDFGHLPRARWITPLLGRRHGAQAGQPTPGRAITPRRGGLPGGPGS